MIDKQQARKAFSKAAPDYDDSAVLQREINQRMFDRLQYIRLEPARILDIGCGTGIAIDLLQKRYPKSELVALDFAMPMVEMAVRRGRWLKRPRGICADMEQLPLRDGAVDLIYSNVALQWCTDVDKTFREFRRVLRPGGLLMFSTFGPDTLREVRDAWASVDGDSHVTPFADMHDIGDSLMRTGFAEPVMDAEWINLTYENVDGLMRDIKAIGAHNVTSKRSRGLTGKGRMQQFRDAYEAFRADGRLPSTWEVVYGHAWAPESALQPRDESGATYVSVDALREGPR